MGYSTNPAVLDARRESLAELEAGRACRWRTTANRQVTKRKAYEIREALYIAGLYPDKYPALAQAYHAFSIHVVEPGLIEAKPRTIETPDIRVQPPATFGGQTPHGRPTPSVGLTTAAEVQASWQKHLPSSDPINFQQTLLPPAELHKLWEWATEQSPKLMILTAEGEAWLTLSLFEAGMQDYAWRPTEVPVVKEEKFNL